jgi:uncharacterized protein (TIGR02001 family)
MTNRALAAILLAALLPSASFAQEDNGLSFGAAVTSDYIYQGFTQTDGKPAVQAYIEGQYGMFYGGVWTSTVDLDDDSLEFDVYAGIRADFDSLSLDLNYTRFLYDDSGDCCGQFVLAAAYGFSETAEAAFEFDWDPENSTTWTVIGGSFGFLDSWEASGTYGSDFGTQELDDGDLQAWDAGVTYFFNDNFWLDGRYYDSTYEDATGVVSAGFDF